MNIAKQSFNIFNCNMMEDSSPPDAKDTINSGKPAFLVIGLNPAGDLADAERDKITGGLFLNYYPEFDNNLSSQLKSIPQNQNPSPRMIYKKYFNPILQIFEEVTGKRECAWEWCNYDFHEIKQKIVCLLNKLNLDAKNNDIIQLRIIYDDYNKSSKYQIIIRDLVYYHQTSGFSKLLKEKTEQAAKDFVKNRIDTYIESILGKTTLKFIYINSATASHYVKEALDGFYSKDCFGTLIYNYCANNSIVQVPIFLGSELSGRHAMDIYSKERLKAIMKVYV